MGARVRWVAILAAVVPVSAWMGQTGAPARSEMDRFSFMVGEWAVDARIKNSPTSYLTGSGTMTVTLEEDGEALVAAMDIAFDDFRVRGTTVRRWDPDGHLWRVSWNDLADPASSEPDIVGRFHGDRFVEVNYGVDARGPFLGRLVVGGISRDAFSVRKDRLYHDGAVRPETWAYEARRVR